jgi:hypothetical protein
MARLKLEQIIEAPFAKRNRTTNPELTDLSM